MTTTEKPKRRKRQASDADEQQTMVQIYQRPVPQPGQVWALFISRERNVRFHTFVTPDVIEIWRRYGWKVIEGWS